MSGKGNNISRSKFYYDYNGWKKIGEGAFGDVWKIKLDKGLGEKNPYVAVKKLRITACMLDFYDERDRIAALDHPNIVKLIGVSPAKNDIPWLVLEYLPRGDLLACLWDYPGQMPGSLMLKIAKDIACGMEYLHDQGEVHGDLAARNCLVDQDWTTKIGDFGKNCYRVSYDNDYCDMGLSFTIPCPIRWMPPENVPRIHGQAPKFTYEGDIWSYGIVLYEIWSGGTLPYDEVSDKGVLEILRFAKDNGKFFDPLNCDKLSVRQHVMDLMDQCWQIQPEKRPTFEDIMDHFEENEPEVA